MKKLFFMAIAAMFTFASCQEEFEMEQYTEPLQEQNENLLRTRANIELENDSNLLCDSIYEAFFVPHQDAVTYAAIHCRGKNAKEFDTIFPMTDGIDTLMYLIQYKNGWDVIAADKRGPLVIAMSDEGKFEFSDTLVGFHAYLEAQKLYLKSMRSVAEYDPNSDAYIFWSMLHPKSQSQARLVGDEGYWMLYDTDTETTTRESGHLIQTRWGQNSPWNTFAPYDSNNPEEKCAVGCVAVAGAQMLYYLHHTLGCPQTMFTSAVCVGNNNSYTINFSNATTAAWNNMALNIYDNSSARRQQSAILLAYVGNAVGMDYGTTSSAKTKKLKDLFSDLGISSTFEDYNSTTAWNSLLNNMPVIISAKTLTDEFPFYGGHAWIMDGWKTVTTAYTYYYGWVPTPQNNNVDPSPMLPVPNPNNPPLIYTETRKEYSSTQTKTVLMNWGWNNDYNNIYCTLEGAWSPYSGVSFQYLKKMLHGFQVN